jgi:DNA-binding transcriptional MerR regulator
VILMDRDGRMVRVWGSGEVSRKTGVSLRQLQWWDERNVISPRLEGHRRVYTDPDIAEIRLITSLRNKNISLQNIRRALHHLRKHPGGVATAFEGNAYLLVDAGLRAIHIESDAIRVCELLKLSPKPMLLVHIPQVERPL